MLLKSWPKMVSANDIYLSSNLRFVLNGLLFDFDFSEVDRHQWKEETGPTNLAQICLYMPSKGSWSMKFEYSLIFKISWLDSLDACWHPWEEQREANIWNRRTWKCSGPIRFGCSLIFISLEWIDIRLWIFKYRKTSIKGTSMVLIWNRHAYMPGNHFFGFAVVLAF